MLKNIGKIIVIFIFGMAGGIFADQIFWPYFVERPLFYQYDLDGSPVYLTEVKEVTITENTALQELLPKLEKAVVGVRTQTPTGSVFQGSGLIVTSDGLMITLAELVPAGSNFTFFVEGKPLSYQVLRRDLEQNLALIKLEGANFTTVGFADIDKLRIGERVFLLGAEHPLTGGKVVNEGIVKSFDEALIQTNISENLSIAGSPLFDIEGKLLGLITIDRQGADRQGAVSAIPISLLQNFLGL